MIKKSHYNQAYDIYLSKNPKFKKKLEESIDSLAFQDEGLSLEEYRNEKIKEEFFRYAESHRTTVIDLVIDLIAENSPTVQ